MKYVWNFTKPAACAGRGHYFVLRDKDSAVAEDMSGILAADYEIVYGGTFNEYMEVGTMYRSLKGADYDKYTFCEDDILVIAYKNEAYAYMMRADKAVALDGSFLNEFSEQFERVYLKWGSRKVAFSFVMTEENGRKILAGYALDVYDENDRMLCSEYFDAEGSNNCLVLLNEALMYLKETVFDTFLHKLVYKTVSKSDRTTFVPDIPETEFCAIDGTFTRRGMQKIREEQEYTQKLEEHRERAKEKYKNLLVTPDLVEDVALIHIKNILDKHADGYIAVRNVIFHEYEESKENDNTRLAKVVVEYDSHMTEMYLHDLLCMESCVYTKGSETVYVEIIPVRKDQTGTFAEYLLGTRSSGFKKVLEDEGIDLYYKGEHGYVLMPHEKDVENAEALLSVYDKEGNVLGSVKAYLYEEDEALPFREPPLLFAELGEEPLTTAQRYKLIELFDNRYKQTQQGYENEFPTVVSMLVSKGAVLLNSKFLRNEELAECVCAIIWPDKENGSEFWIGAVEHESGNILEVHTLEEAKQNDYHAMFYFSEDVVNRQDKCEVSYFWIAEGRVQIDWETELYDEVGANHLCERINSQIKIMSDSAAIWKGGASL